jgi:DNA-binding response OmpR family regulator
MTPRLGPSSGPDVSGDPLLRVPVLLVDDDDMVASLIMDALNAEGHAVTRSASLDDAVARLPTISPRLVLVDLGLPDGNGMALVRRLAGRPECRVMVISGRKTELDRILALEVGADDFISKPFSPRELRARIGALLRRMDAAPLMDAAAASEGETLEVDGIRLEPGALRIVGQDGTATRLTAAEGGLLALLIRHRDGPVSREEIGRQVLGAAPLPQQRGVDQLVSVLRGKIAAAGSTRVRIVPIRSVGYRLIV